MKRKILSLFSVAIGFFGYSQTEVYFKYDEAGNQRYRGPDVNAKQQPTVASAPQPKEESVMDAKEFWSNIRLYPVPVNDVLTMDWTEEVDALIETVSLYQHSGVHWKFQQQNLPNLNRQLKINMTGYEWGVYVLHLKLKDGRVFSRNITKR